MRSSLPSRLSGFWAFSLRVAGAAAVPGADVEHAVVAELELAAVVVRLAWMRDHDEGSARARVGTGRRAALALEAVDLDVALAVDVVDEEAPVALRSSGSKAIESRPSSEESLDPVADVEEWLGELAAVAHDRDRARLLDHEQKLALLRRVLDEHRGVEASDPAQLETGAGGGRTRRGQRDRCGDDRRQDPAKAAREAPRHPACRVARARHRDRESPALRPSVSRRIRQDPAGRPGPPTRSRTHGRRRPRRTSSAPGPAGRADGRRRRGDRPPR